MLWATVSELWHKTYKWTHSLCKYEHLLVICFVLAPVYVLSRSWRAITAVRMTIHAETLL